MRRLALLHTQCSGSTCELSPTQACASRSRIVRGLAQPLLVVVAVATLTAVYETAREVRDAS